jgi:hypothetical protein
MNKNFTTTFMVDQSPEDVFAAINNVRGWWEGDIEGITDTIGEEWTYRHKDIHYSKQKTIDLVPGKKVVWRVTDSQLNFVEDKDEWTGTEITFDISQKGDKTELRFTHLGLVSEFECFDACSNAWGFYINSSLRSFIATGKPQAQQEAKESLIKLNPVDE